MTKLVFSRKGFDSAAGGTASPILDGRLVSLPIPTTHRSEATYDRLGLGEVVKAQTKGRISRGHLCHADPAFHDGRCALGQTGAAQSHLANSKVGVGDIFLFFGLFRAPDSAPGHWIFGWLKVEEVRLLGAASDAGQLPRWLPYQHPHTIGAWNPNNTLYEGRGGTFDEVHEDLRLTAAGARTSIWHVPGWLRECGLSYHAAADRWEPDDRLRVVGRGQEFVADIGNRLEAHAWIATLCRASRE